MITPLLGLESATLVRNAVAIQRGTERPNEVVIVQGHIDSRVSDVMDFTSDAPGANDDGSGTALVIEAARVLSKAKYPTTIVYALLSGEEQGLFGGQLLADYAKLKQSWGGWTGYDRFMAEDLNNAKLGVSGLYTQYVPAFKALHKLCGQSFQRFYAATEMLGEFSREQREILLAELQRGEPLSFGFKCL